jgi:hypothetical protein
MDEYTVGNCEIEISDCPKINVYNLKLRSHQEIRPMNFGGGIEQRHVGPVKWEADFRVTDRILQDNKQVWFQQFNSKSQISAHLGREKLKIHLDVNYKLSLIGYLMMPSVNSEIGFMWFNFNFNGTVGDDISLVPDLYADSLIGSPYSQEDLEGPTTEELAEDFEYITKKVIAEAKPKFKKRVSFKKSDEIIVIQRKITF